MSVVYDMENLMNDGIDVFIERYRKPVPLYLKEIEKKARESMIPVMEHTTADVIRYILRTGHIEKILEIGTAVGYSALYMSECMKDMGTYVSVTTVELIPERISEAKKNFSLYDTKKNITLIEGDAGDVLADLVKKGEKYDMVFLDAAKGQYPVYLADIVSVMSGGAILVTDNIFHGGAVTDSKYAVTRRDRTIHDRVREYLELIKNTDELESLCLPVDDGVLIARKAPYI